MPTMVGVMADSYNAVVGGGGVSLVTSVGAAHGSTRTVSVTFSGYTPVAGDMVHVFSGCNNAFALTAPSGWTNPLGGATAVASTAQGYAWVTHIVDAGEVSGGVNSWTLTNLFAALETGRTTGVIFRGQHAVTPVAAFDSAVHGSAFAAAPTPGLASGVVTVSGGLVVRVAEAENGTYGSPPAGTTGIISGVNNAIAQFVGADDALSTSGVAVGSVSIPVSPNATYCVLTFLLAPA